MEKLFKQAWLRYPLAAMALASCIPAATASTLSTEPAADASTAALGTLPLHEALRTSSASALAELPAEQSALLPLPSSFFTLNNPYVLFADVLAMSSSSPQSNSSGQIFIYDASNNLPAPGPVPLPNPLLLLLCGAGLLLASRGRTGAPAA
jgi:hypothetical protein